jgi:hypothetical protein
MDLGKKSLASLIAFAGAAGGLAKQPNALRDLRVKQGFSVGRKKFRAKGTKGLPPELRRPHSEPQVHLRTRDGKHEWIDLDVWNRKGDLVVHHGTVIEMVNGWGQVTHRTWM